jgi:hypothetical protein
VSKPEIITRYEVIEKSSKQKFGETAPSYFLHLQFCGGRPAAYDRGSVAVIQVGEQTYHAVVPGDKIKLQYEVIQ